MRSALLALVLVAGPSLPRVDVGTLKVPSRIRARLLDTLAKVTRCETVEDSSTRSTCTRLPNGGMHYVDRHKRDGSLMDELIIEPDYDGVERGLPLPGGGWARETRFTWSHAPEVVIEEDSGHTGHFDTRTEGTLNVSRSRLHLVKRVLAPDGTWKLARAWEATVLDVDQSVLVFLASGDWEKHVVAEELASAPEPEPSPLEPVSRLPSSGLDLDNDGKPDIFPLPGAVLQSGALAVRGIYGGAGVLLFSDGAPYQYEEKATLFLRTVEVRYFDSNLDGRFDRREVRTQWTWQSLPKVVRERDPGQSGKWVDAAERAPDLIVPR